VRLPDRRTSSNIVAPGSNVTYRYNNLELLTGAKIRLNGKSAHARYMSLTSYGTVTANGTTFSGIGLTRLSDYEIRPGKGSVIPFLSGVKRDSKAASSPLPSTVRTPIGIEHAAYLAQLTPKRPTRPIRLIRWMHCPPARRSRNSMGTARSTPSCSWRGSGPGQ
jgi:hypothetical protein